ncbi:AraC family transcriptional regulator [Streptococcus marmotae]|uniref:AraC family transcriptional regulator n=1 Tax=Streptococcus marmotae TaxID=1825069 RepID=UPI0008355F99|nr:helix-turn-helix domain-containing protein [Streptococcus marmotae]
MNDFILELLLSKREHREWEEILENLHPVPAKFFEGEAVYEFFHNLDDSLDINLQPIAISVNPVESYIPYHYHNYVEMIIPIKGRMTILVEHEEIILQEGDIFIVGPNTIHQNKSIGKENLVFNIALKQTAFSHSDLDFLRRSGSSSYLADLLFFSSSMTTENGMYTIFHTKDTDGVQHTIENIVYEYYNILDNQSNHIIQYELLVLFAKLLRLSSRESSAVQSSRKTESTLLSLLLYIEKHYASVTLEEMGKHFGFNPNYLSTYLRKHTGHSFVKLLHIQRVNVAAEYLRYTTAPIEKISLKVGYENPSYFYKIFKKILGMSPAEYRKQVQKQ